MFGGNHIIVVRHTSFYRKLSTVATITVKLSSFHANGISWSGNRAIISNCQRAVIITINTNTSACVDSRLGVFELFDGNGVGVSCTFF